MASETIADIVAEKRHRADEIERDVSAKMASGKMVSDRYAREVIADLRREADRIETAWERERQPLTIAEWIDKTETVADIAAVLRRYVLPSLAERLEAAWKRERLELEQSALSVGATVERSRMHNLVSRETQSTVHKQICAPQTGGNAAALREALAAIIAYWDWNGFDAMRESQLKDMARAALSAPARNCDMFADEDDAFAAWHDSLNDGDVVSVRNAFRWLFAPAAERKGDGDE